MGAWVMYTWAQPHSALSHPCTEHPRIGST